MKFASLVEIAAAAHQARMVVGDDVGHERSGVMFVSPPGHLKTSCIEIVEQFPHAKVISNLTVKALNAMRQDFISGEIQTLAFSDYEMIYKRHQSTASQIEGTLMALAGEGFRNPAFSDQRVHVVPARCTIVGGMTIKFYESKISEWLDNGFARRFLWCRYSIANIDKLELFLAKWRRAELDGHFTMKIPAGNIIPYKLSEELAKKVLWELRFQPDRKIPFVFAQRILSVLLWKHNNAGWDIWNDFVPSLGKDEAVLTI
jgi:hypothetical protein